MPILNDLRAKPGLALFVIYVRYLIGGTFVYAGWGKAMGGRFMPASSGQLPPTGLSIDVFFDVLYRTGAWWQFMGWAQLLAGVLVATQRWGTLGAIALLPVSLNMFVITLSMAFHGTPVITGLLVVANVGLLIWDYARLQPLLLPNRNATVSLPIRSDQLNHSGYWEILGLLVVGTSLSFGNRENPLLWFALCAGEGLLGLVGWLVIKRTRPNASLTSR